MKLQLQGRVALVCGGSSGLGFASAKALAAEGVNVCLASRNPEKLLAAENDIRRIGGNAQSICADLYDVKQTPEIVRQVHDFFGPPDILVLNNGGPPPLPAAEFNETVWRDQIEGHLLSSIALTSALLPQMRKQRFGRILLIASTSVIEPIPGLVISNALRAGLANWAKTLAQEVASEGITVNTILPGSFDTLRTRDLLKRASARSGVSVDALIKEELQAIPAGRYGHPDELGKLITFLSSPVAGFISGTKIPIDGASLRTS